MCVLIACGEDSQDTLAQVNVKFMIGDAVISEATYTEGDTVANPNISEYQSLTVSYWTVNGNSRRALFPYKVGNTDLVFYAHTIQNINASFYSDGTEVQSGTYSSNDFIQAPQSPTKDGYRFRYWAINNQEASFPYYLNNETETRLRFDAVFEKLYTVQFVSDGNVVTTNEYLKGDTIVMAPTPSKSNNTFIYWQDANGNRFEEGSKVVDDATYTAIFEKDLYSATYYVGTSQRTYKVLYTSGKVLDLKYEGDGNFYGWYTTKNYTQKYDFSKPISGNVSIYGKVYSTDYEIIYSRGSNQKAPIDPSNFNSTYGFSGTSYPTYISISVGGANIKATYTFYNNGQKLTIAYDMMTNGEILCTYGAYSQIKIVVPKYNYEAISFNSYTTYDLKNGQGNTYYNEKLEQFGLFIASEANAYIQSIYDTTKADGIISTGVEDPDLNVSLNVTTLNNKISATTNLNYYSLKVQDSSGNYVYYSQNANSSLTQELKEGTYKVIAIFENPKEGYVLRQILTYAIYIA